MSAQSVELERGRQGQAEQASTPVCPYCGAELTIGYTEHGTMVWDGKAWSDSDRGSDAEYYCLECNAELDYEELEELGVF